MLVSLNDYASQYKKSGNTIRRLAEKGMLRTTRKTAQNWVVDDTEPYPVLKRNLEKNYKFIDLFAGIGGIRLGFERAFGKNSKTVFVSAWRAFLVKLSAWLGNGKDLMITIREFAEEHYF